MAGLFASSLLTGKTFATCLDSARTTEVNAHIRPPLGLQQ